MRVVLFIWNNPLFLSFQISTDILNAKEKLSFSIVIPCRNEENYIGQCIDSILNQNYDQSLIEILIVDGESTDKTRTIVKKYIDTYKNIKLLDNPAKKTPHALNIGVKNSNGEVIVILGAHTKVDENFLFYNNKFLQEKNVKVTGGTQHNIGKTYTQNLIGLAMEMPFAMASAKYRWSKSDQFVDTVVYAAYRKELFDELGLFEENQIISEDAEFNWRIRKAGYKIYFSPKIKTYYFPRSSIKDFIYQIFRYGILRVNVLLKHKNALKLLHFIPPLFVITLITLLILSIFSEFWTKITLFFLAVYFAVNIISSLLHTFPKKLKYFPLLPILVFLMHVSWGLGFLIGLINHFIIRN